jgi:TM2 domain-containing membrane protein YozV
MSLTNCPQCGAPLSADTSTCEYCGEKIVSAADAADLRTAPNPEPQVTVNVNPNVVNNDPYGINPNWPVKSKVAAGVLGILLGSLGIHKFYLGKIGMGVLYLLFCWTAIPGIIGLVEGIIYLCTDDYTFQLKHHVRIIN